MPDQLQTLDTRLLRLVNGRHTPFWDGGRWWASQPFTWRPFYAALLAVLGGSLGRRARVLLSWATLAAHGRVYLGVHYSINVLLATLLSVPLACGISRLYAWGPRAGYPVLLLLLYPLPDG